MSFTHFLEYEPCLFLSHRECQNTKVGARRARHKLSLDNVGCILFIINIFSIPIYKKRFQKSMDGKAGNKWTHFQKILTLSMINRPIPSPIQLYQSHTRSRFLSNFFPFLFKGLIRFFTISVPCDPPNISFRCLYETCKMKIRIELCSGLVEL